MQGKTVLPIPSQDENQKHLDAVEKALREKGSLDHTIMQGVFLGPARSGKSSLIKRLTGEGPVLSSPSTGVAEEPILIEVRQSYSVPLCVTDSTWFKLTYNTEACGLMLRISHFFSQRLSKEAEEAKPSQQASLSSCPDLTAFSSSVSDFESGVHAAGGQPMEEPRTVSLPVGYKSPIEILRAAANEEDVGEYLENSWSLYLTDTGGQMEFQDLLPLLVSGPSVFFITFRLDRDLSEVFTIQYELADGNKSQPYKTTLTVLEAILQSLASISSMGSFIYKGLQEQNVSFRPKVFLVGTHKDVLDPLTASKQIQEIDQNLQKVIKSTSHYRDSLVEFATPNQLIFTVNNLSHDDTDFQRIRLAVEKLAQRGDFKISSPSHWLILSLVIRYLKPRIISFEECLSVALQCGITDEEELKEALHFLHTKMGVLRYFSDEGLGDIIVKDPQVLFDKVTELIVQTFTFDGVGRYLADEFTKKGIFSLRDFERVSGGSNPLLTPAHLVKLLQRLRIVAPFQTDEGDTKYFIPCVLNHAKVSEVIPEGHNLLIPPLVVTFKCGYCPKGLSGALITYILTNEMQSELDWQLKLDEIFRDQVSIYVGPDFDTVTLKILPQNIKISFIANIHLANRTCSMEEICTEVRSSIEKGIVKVAFDMHYLHDAKHSVTFNCQCDTFHNNPHPAKMSWHKGKPSKLLCNQTQQCFELPPGGMVWFGHPLQSTSHPIPITTHHQDLPMHQGTLNPTHLNEVFRLLLPLATEWYNIGILLKISDGELRSIEADFRKSRDCLREMLSTWLKQTDHCPTWQILAESVEQFDPNLSQTVQEKCQHVS